jgi:hypothetical protein
MHRITILEGDRAFRLVSARLNCTTKDIAARPSHREPITLVGSQQVLQLEGATLIWQEYAPADLSRQLQLRAEVDPAKIQAPTPTVCCW